MIEKVVVAVLEVVNILLAVIGLYLAYNLLYALFAAFDILPLIKFNRKGDHVSFQLNARQVNVWSTFVGFWWSRWKPAWFGGLVTYTTLGLGFVSFYAGDPVGAKADRIHAILKGRREANDQAVELAHRCGRL